MVLILPGMSLSKNGSKFDFLFKVQFKNQNQFNSSLKEELLADFYATVFDFSFG